MTLPSLEPLTTLPLGRDSLRYAQRGSFSSPVKGLTPGEPFKAGFVGRCRACGEFYQPGDLIVGQGKGYGALHKECVATWGLRVTRR